MAATGHDAIRVKVDGSEALTGVDWTETDAAAVRSEWDRVSAEWATVEPHSFCSKCGSFLGGLVFLIVAIIGLSLAHTLDTSGSFSGGPFAACLIIALVLAVSVPCCYAPAQPEQMNLPRAVPRRVPGASTEGATLPYRSTRTVDLVETSKVGSTESTTLRELWDNTVSRCPTNPCIGERKVLRTYTQMVEMKNADGEKEKRPFLRKVLAPSFSFHSFAEANDVVVKYARALNKLVTTHKGSYPGHAGIFASTRRGWQMTAQACFRAGIPLATVYNTLGPDGLAYAAYKTRVSVLIVEDATLPTLAQVIDGMDVDSGKVNSDGENIMIAADLSSVKSVITLDEVPSDEEVAASTGGKDGKPIKTVADAVRVLRERDASTGGPVEVISMDSAVESGDAKDEPDAPSPDDTAVIMFTSGSTGLPKGVEVLHRNLVACAAGLGVCLPDVKLGDVYLAYLPLSHILELAAELCVLSQSGAVGYGSVYTLTAASPMVPQPTDDEYAANTSDVGQVHGDAFTLRPTIMAAVPAVVTRIQKGVMGKVNSGSAVKKWLVNYAVTTCKRLYAEGSTAPLLEGLVFDKVRTEVLGGRVRMMASGGGPLTAGAQMWMNVVMRAPLRQGYGLTETCGGGTLQWADDRSVAAVGPPILSNDIKLIDWEEGGYLTTSNPPRGEICICGGNVTKGYYEEPEKTAEAFVEEDGRVWFRTGDVGLFEPDGCLRIIDRKKDLLKLSSGEYISLGKMEAVYTTIPCVQNAVCYGDSTQSYSVCCVIVDPANLPEELRRSGEKAYVGDEAIADHVHGLIREAMRGKTKNKGEVVGKVYVVGTTYWLPTSGLVTASMKIQRRKVTDYYMPAFKYLYGSGPDPREEIAAKVPAQL